MQLIKGGYSLKKKKKGEKSISVDSLSGANPKILYNNGLFKKIGPLPMRTTDPVGQSMDPSLFTRPYI